jgi:hypothetical protein
MYRRRHGHPPDYKGWQCLHTNGVSAGIKHPQYCRFCRWECRRARARDTRMRRRATCANVVGVWNCAMTDSRGG